VDSLEQVVAQKRVVRCPVREGALERGDVQDPFPRIAPLSEQVLVHVRHGVRVEVETRVRLHDAREGRRLPPAGGCLEPGLEHRVARAHPAPAVKPGPVQRVGQRRDESCRGARRQVSVGVERDHVPDPGELLEVALHRPEASVVRAEKQLVQLVQLAALTLPSHPATLGGIPLPGSVQEEEREVAVLPVGGVESRHAIRGPLQDRLVRRRVLGGGIGPVSKQCPPHVGVGVSLVPHLEARQQGVDLPLVAHQYGNRDNRAGVVWNSVRRVELGQHARRDEDRGQPVGHAERDGRGGDKAAQQQDHDRGARRARRDRRPGHEEQEEEGERGSAAPVCQPCVPQDEAPRAGTAGRPVAEAPLQGRPPPTDQPVADVPPRRVAHGRDGPGAPHNFARDRFLLFLAPAGQFLDGTPVAVPCLEIHAQVNTGRISSQDALYTARPLHEPAPVVSRQGPKAADSRRDDG